VSVSQFSKILKLYKYIQKYIYILFKYISAYSGIFYTVVYTIRFIISKYILIFYFWFTICLDII